MLLRGLLFLRHDTQKRDDALIFWGVFTFFLYFSLFFFLVFLAFVHDSFPCIFMDTHPPNQRFFGHQV